MGIKDQCSDISTGVAHVPIRHPFCACQVVFFDSTPIGRIVNRFSKDQRLVDTGILPTLSLCLSAFANLLSTLFLIGINTPYTLVVLVPISLLFVQTQAQYRRAAREIKRMESTTRSPVYSHYGETLQGLVVLQDRHQDRAHQSTAPFILRCGLYIMQMEQQHRFGIATRQPSVGAQGGGG